jgi:hypothetical protein
MRPGRLQLVGATRESSGPRVRALPQLAAQTQIRAVTKERSMGVAPAPKVTGCSFPDRARRRHCRQIPERGRTRAGRTCGQPRLECRARRLCFRNRSLPRSPKPARAVHPLHSQGERWRPLAESPAEIHCGKPWSAVPTTSRKSRRQRKTMVHRLTPGAPLWLPRAFSCFFLQGGRRRRGLAGRVDSRPRAACPRHPNAREELAMHAHAAARQRW